MIERMKAHISGHMTLELPDGVKVEFPFYTHVMISPSLNEEDRTVVKLAVEFAAYDASRLAFRNIEKLKYTLNGEEKNERPESQG